MPHRLPPFLIFDDLFYPYAQAPGDLAAGLRAYVLLVQDSGIALPAYPDPLSRLADGQAAVGQRDLELGIVDSHFLTSNNICCYYDTTLKIICQQQMLFFY